MKLVEILALELKEWPNGWIAVGQACDGCLHGEPFDGRHTEEKYSICDQYITEEVTRAEWQAAVDALKADECTHSYSNNHGCPECGKSRHDSPSLHLQQVGRIKREWTGEGLPPVGTVCEVQTWVNREWRKTTVLAHHLGFAVHSWSADGDDIEVEVAPAGDFRPFPTPEQIAAEEREKAACDLYCTINWQGGAPEWRNQSSDRKRDYFRAIDAGYRKQEQE